MLFESRKLGSWKSNQSFACLAAFDLDTCAGCLSLGSALHVPDSRTHLHESTGTKNSGQGPVPAATTAGNDLPGRAKSNLFANCAGRRGTGRRDEAQLGTTGKSKLASSLTSVKAQLSPPPRPCTVCFLLHMHSLGTKETIFETMSMLHRRQNNQRETAKRRRHEAKHLRVARNGVAPRTMASAGSTSTRQTGLQSPRAAVTN